MIFSSFMNTHTINNGPYCLFYGVIQANSNSSLPVAFGIIVSVKRPLSLLNHRRSYNTRLLFFLHERWTSVWWSEPKLTRIKSTQNKRSPQISKRGLHTHYNRKKKKKQWNKCIRTGEHASIIHTTLLSLLQKYISWYLNDNITEK